MEGSNGHDGSLVVHTFLVPQSAALQSALSTPFVSAPHTPTRLSQAEGGLPGANGLQGAHVEYTLLTDGDGLGGADGGERGGDGSAQQAQLGQVGPMAVGQLGERAALMLGAATAVVGVGVVEGAPPLEMRESFSLLPAIKPAGTAYFPTSLLFYYSTVLLFYCSTLG